MKNIDLLPTSEEKKRRLKEFAQAYRQYARLFIDILAVVDDKVIVLARQTPDAHRMLSKKDIVQRVKEVFLGEIPETMKVHVRFPRKQKTDGSI